jgi:YidC/Oxa1 family membrane protein insertase
MRRLPPVLLLAVLAQQAAAGTVDVRAGSQQLSISTVTGLPVAWTACEDSCERTGVRRVALIESRSGAVAWRGAALPAAEYAATVTESPEGITAVFTAQAPGGARLVQRYEISRRTHALQLQLTVPAGASLHLKTGTAFVPEALPGFGGAFSGVDAIRVGPGGQEILSAEDIEPGKIDIEAGEWLGIRSHFWAWLWRSSATTAAEINRDQPGQPSVQWQLPPGTHELQLYAGPIAWKNLRVVAPELTQMLFAAIWQPLRWISYALLFLLGWITSATGNVGVSIILLSLAVKIVLWPLTNIADRWQAEVNRIQGRLQPRLDAIRREFKGEEAHNRVLAVYKEEGVHTLYTLKSLAGFAIQVPVFIGAFDMLADNFALSGMPFLWIDDLAKPDRWLALPVAVPFFGAHLNLLPCLMTAVTIISAMSQADPSLTPELARRQRLRLYAMAGAFFLLFYTFPAGMVLYWTANNLWHLLKVQVMQRLPGRA